MRNERIRSYLEKAHKTETIGRSDAEILMFDDAVLKIQQTSSCADQEYEMLMWLDGKLPAPRVLAFERENGKNYLLMTRLSGEMACDAKQNPAAVVRGLARGLKKLWEVDISNCPVMQDIQTKLALAEKRLQNGELPAEKAADFNTRLQALSENRPHEELVFSHGDYCLPNVFLQADMPVGFLDFGSAGVADKWYDIMMCLWSLAYNFKELGHMSDAEFARMHALFFEELGLLPDEKKLLYHEKLDEFFI